jgi:hypothetical protein
MSKTEDWFLDRIVFPSVNRVSGRTVAAIALVLYPGLGLVAPLAGQLVLHRKPHCRLFRGVHQPGLADRAAGAEPPTASRRLDNEPAPSLG